jgi:hypothetical protein
VPLPFSRTQIDRLGDRLRAGVTPEDAEMLHELLLAHAEPLQLVATRLTDVGLKPTTRLKTWSTIVEKLQREETMGLKGMRDLAGARVVVGMTLLEQETALSTVLDVWPSARVIDRREEPMHGYRAVHVVPRIDGCFVEVQIRTGLQNVWAQTLERFADGWGRQIRYGEPPFDPDTRAAEQHPITRGELIDYLREGLSAAVAVREHLEHRIHLRGVMGILEGLLDKPVLDPADPEDAELLNRLGSLADDEAELARRDEALADMIEMAREDSQSQGEG